eukprot:7344081-Prymnesium_polylepis.2
MPTPPLHVSPLYPKRSSLPLLSPRQVRTFPSHPLVPLKPEALPPSQPLQSCLAVQKHATSPLEFPNQPHAIPVAECLWQLVRPEILPEPSVVARKLQHGQYRAPDRTSIQASDCYHVLDDHERGCCSAHVRYSVPASSCMALRALPCLSVKSRACRLACEKGRHLNEYCQRSRRPSATIISSASGSSPHRKECPTDVPFGCLPCHAAVCAFLHNLSGSTWKTYSRRFPTASLAAAMKVPAPEPTSAARRGP